MYRVASIVNSNVSKQWFCDKYAMKALSVHGGDAVFASTSCSVGRRGQYGPAGIERLRGLDGCRSPDDMKPSSSASQSDRTDEQRGDVSFITGLAKFNEGGFRYFDLRIALRRYFMGTKCLASFSSSKRVLPLQTLQNHPATMLVCESCPYYTTERYLVECIGRRVWKLYKEVVRRRLRLEDRDCNPALML